MRILLVVLGLVSVIILIWALRRWVQHVRNDNEQDDAEHYASLLNLYAQDCARHLDAAQNPERSWNARMERLNEAEEAKQKHTETLRDAPTDMRDQDFDAPPSANLHSLRNDLFNARKGDPSLSRRVLRKDEQIDHARALERAAAHLRAHGDTPSADEVDALAADIYRELIAENPKQPAPYLHLAALYRRQEDTERERELLRQALDKVDFESQEQRRDLDDRLENLQHLRGA